jgi:hypothetical protein
MWVCLQVLLSENWVAKAAEAAEAAAAAASAPADGTPTTVPAFNPADPQFNVSCQQIKRQDCVTLHRPGAVITTQHVPY